MINVLIVDDHRMVLEGLRLVITREPDMAVVAAASTVTEAIAAYRRERPDVMVLDLQLGQESGVEVIRTVRGEFPDARIVVVTMYHGHENIYRAMQAGATTYLVKNSLADDLICTIREVHAGRRPISADVEAGLRERAALPALTAREVQVLELIARGHRNKKVAAALAISEETVGVHVKNLLAKMHVSDRVAAVHLGVRRGIIHIA